MKFMGISVWTIVLIVGAMVLQSKYNLVAKLPLVNRI